MNVLVSIESMVSMMNVKEGIISDYGKLLLTVSIVYLLLQ